MKIKVISKKKWKAHKIELARKQALLLEYQHKIASATRDVDILASALWDALYKPDARSLMRAEVHPDIVGDVGYKISDNRVELFLKSLLPE